MSVSEALSTGLQTTVVGLAIVFAVLIIIMLVLYCFNFIFTKQHKQQKPQTAQTSVPEPAEEKIGERDEEELIAVLAAAAAASLNTSTYNLKIKSYRRVNTNTTSWNRAGITDTLNNRI